MIVVYIELSPAIIYSKYLLLVSVLPLVLLLVLLLACTTIVAAALTPTQIQSGIRFICAVFCILLLGAVFCVQRLQKSMKYFSGGTLRASQAWLHFALIMLAVKSFDMLISLVATE